MSEHVVITRHPGGRPTKYDPNMCEIVIALGAEGKSRTEIAFELGVVKATIQNWEAEHPEFLAAMTRAKEAEQTWWERKGRENLGAQHFQASMWSRSMGARFPDEWRESSKQELSGPNGTALIPSVNVNISRPKS